VTAVPCLLRRKKPRTGYIFIIILSLGLIIGSLMVLEGLLRPGIRIAAEVKARQIVVSVINQAVKEIMVDETVSADLVAIHKDSQGRVVLMQPNTVRINRLVANTTLHVQEALSDLSQESFSFPLGEAVNSPLLSSYGPAIDLKLRPTGSARIELEDRFEAAGINQTRYSIYLKIESEVVLLTPVLSQDVKVATTLPLTETIIVGEVPAAYLQFTK
jgi:sporulation protein YunB